MVLPHRTYPTTSIAWWISRRGDVCSSRLCCSSTCRALIVVLLVTECSLLSVRRSGTVCHTTLLPVCHWHHSVGNWKHFCFLYHFHDYIFLFVVFEIFTWATLKISYACICVFSHYQHCTNRGCVLTKILTIRQLSVIKLSTKDSPSYLCWGRVSRLVKDSVELLWQFNW